MFPYQNPIVNASNSPRSSSTAAHEMPAEATVEQIASVAFANHQLIVAHWFKQFVEYYDFRVDKPINDMLNQEV